MINTTCTGCRKQVDWLEEFPKQRCLDCHASAPEVQRELRTMTADKLAKTWGAK